MFLDRLTSDPDGCVEMRVFDADLSSRGDKVIPGVKWKKTLNCWGLAADIVRESTRLSNVSAYVTLNPVSRDFMARRTKLGQGDGASSDEDTLRINWLYLDLDAKRISGVSSSDSEFEAALKLRNRILDENEEIKRSSMWGGSGNGGWNLIRLSGRRNTPETYEYIQRFLKILSERYSSESVVVDVKTCNASRVMCLVGTLKCKGENRPERPWRMVTLDSPLDAEIEPFDLEDWVEANSPLQGEPEPEKVEPKTEERFRTKVGSGADLVERARKYIAERPAAISGQNGHGDTFAVACILMWGFALDRSDAKALILEYNQRCSPPWSDKELDHKLDSAMTAKHDKPYGHLRDTPPPNGHHQSENRKDGKEESRSKEGSGGFGSASQGHSQFSWGEPKPIEAALAPVPKMDPELIPEPFRDWLQDIANRGCFPLEYPAVAAIVSLSGVIGRRIAVKPKVFDDWYVVPNLWGAVVGPPGIQKSPAVEEAMRPIKGLEAAAIQRNAEAAEQFECHKMVRDSLRKAAEKRLDAEAKKGTSPAVLHQLAMEARGGEEVKPADNRVLVNDSTVEKLQEILVDNPNGLTWFRDELTGLFKSMDRQGHEGDRSFLLESWNGYNSFTVDRIGRGTKHIPKVCLAILGTIQPGPLAHYLRGAASGEDADGFMPRFQVLVYPDPPREFVNHDIAPNYAARKLAGSVFEAMANLDPRDLAGCSYDQEREIAFIGFAPDAQDLFVRWRTDLEVRLRSGRDNPLIINHLAKYRKLMPSLALIFHMIDSRGVEYLDPISLESTARAAAWCDFLEAHAHRVYQCAMDGDPESARRLADRIKQSLPNPFTYRDIYRKNWSGLGTLDDVRKAVGILEDRGWVKVVSPESGPSGGRPSEQVWINPCLTGGVE